MTPLQLTATVGLLALGIWTLVAAPASRWYDPLLRVGGAAAFAGAGIFVGWLSGQRRCSRVLRRQVLAWEGTLDVVLHWIEELNLPLTAVKDLEELIAKLLTD